MHVVISRNQRVLERLGSRVRHGPVEFLMECCCYIVTIMGPLGALSLTQVVLYAVLVPKRHSERSLGTKSGQRSAVGIFRRSASIHLRQAPLRQIMRVL